MCFVVIVRKFYCWSCSVLFLGFKWFFVCFLFFCFYKVKIIDVYCVFWFCSEDIKVIDGFEMCYVVFVVENYWILCFWCCLCIELINVIWMSVGEDYLRLCMKKVNCEYIVLKRWYKFCWLMFGVYFSCGSSCIRILGIIYVMLGF